MTVAPAELKIWTDESQKILEALVACADRKLLLTRRESLDASRVVKIWNKDLPRDKRLDRLNEVITIRIIESYKAAGWSDVIVSADGVLDDSTRPCLSIVFTE